MLIMLKQSKKMKKKEVSMTFVALNQVITTIPMK